MHLQIRQLLNPSMILIRGCRILWNSSRISIRILMANPSDDWNSLPSIFSLFTMYPNLQNSMQKLQKVYV
jgi:hypothetical protein